MCDDFFECHQYGFPIGFSTDEINFILNSEETNKDLHNNQIQRMAIASAAVLTAKSNNQIKKPIKPLLKITLVIFFL